jgi:alanine racemase
MTLASQSLLHINLGAVARNWQKYHALGAPITAAVIKANAYGLGAKEIGSTLYDQGARVFFVAHINEAVEARNFLPNDAQIYVLNGFFDGEGEFFNKYNISPIINSLPQYEIWAKQNPNCEFALHIDTGMNRLGLRFDDFKNFEQIAKNPNLKFIMSHLACASDKNSSMNKLQYGKFVKASQYFENIPKSLSASAGALLGKEYLFDIIRPGIGLYGSNPLDDCENIFETVATLTSPILQIRHVKIGESIGYGATFFAKRDMQIAIVALGYADGFIRHSSNVGFAYFNGKKTPILGRVSMDLIAIDISNIENAKETNQIEFIGENALIDKIAQAAETISYEFLTRLGSRFERKYISE